MPPSYRVFIGAPSIRELANDPKAYSWHTTSSGSASSSTEADDAPVPVPVPVAVGPAARTQTSRGGVSAKSSMSIGPSTSTRVHHNSIQHEQPCPALRPSQSFVLPPAALEEASRRISLIYRDLVVLSAGAGGGEDEDGEDEMGGEGERGENDEDEEGVAEGVSTGVLESGMSASKAQSSMGIQSEEVDASSEGEIVIPGLDPNGTKSVEVSVFRGVEQTTLISWPPSNSRVRYDETRDTDNNNSKSFAAPSFLLDNTTDQTHSRIGASTDVVPGDATNANRTSQFTGTQTQAPESQSFGAYSDASSIARFPAFHFSLHALTPLSALADAKHPTAVAASSKPQAQQPAGWHGPGGPRPPAPRRPGVKVNLLLAVLEVDGPDTVRLKRGADAGAQVSVLKLIVGDEAGNVARLTAWRETAEAWAGQGGGGGVEVKRGDIVHIENVTATHGDTPPGGAGGSGATLLLLSASPFLKSKLTICYRTMPVTPHDARLRPDLRLGISEPSVRRVAGVVEWFERMAGLG